MPSLATWAFSWYELVTRHHIVARRPIILVRGTRQGSSADFAGMPRSASPPARRPRRTAWRRAPVAPRCTTLRAPAVERRPRALSRATWRAGFASARPVAAPLSDFRFRPPWPFVADSDVSRARTLSRRAAHGTRSPRSSWANAASSPVHGRIHAGSAGRAPCR